MDLVMRPGCLVGDFAESIGQELRRLGITSLGSPVSGSPYIEVIASDEEQLDPDPERSGIVWFVNRQVVDLEFYRGCYGSGDALFAVDHTPHEVGEIVRARLNGLLYVPAAIAVSLFTGISSTTPAERAVLPRLRAGESAGTIASDTHYSERHVFRLKRSLTSKGLL